MVSAEDTNHPNFAQLPDVIVRVAELDVSLYPMLQHRWSVDERVYAFWVNKNAIKAIPINAFMEIGIIGTQLNQAAFADGTKNGRIPRFLENWVNMTHLIIISSHDNSGAVMNNATADVDNMILLPVVAGLITNCCPVDVQFVCLELELDYTILSARLGSPIAKVVYYLEFPQISIDLANGAGVDRSLITWHGATNLPALLVEQLCTNVLEEGPYENPIDLSAARDFSTEVTTDDEVFSTILPKRKKYE